VVCQREKKLKEEIGRVGKEQQFHDSWAEQVDVSTIDVDKIHSALTSPELRYIHRQLGDLAGLDLLDLGCGLGEASVGFALRGARVTASDLSPGMLAATAELAERYGVSVKTHLSTAENLEFDAGAEFDIVYAGNLLHHVDVEETVKRIAGVVKSGGRFVSWDPLKYNPVINVYRKMASAVRTEDEHPLGSDDLKIVEKYFSDVEFRFFWLFTLVVFLLMFLIDWRNPSAERFWKIVVDESDRWSWLYVPLAKLDQLVLGLIPGFRWLCWNVVIVARK